MTPRTTDALDRNQRLLLAELERIRRLLEGHAAQAGQAGSPARPGTRGSPDATAGTAPEATERAGEPPPALRSLCEAFSLSTFERDVLLLCAGVELDSALGALCATAHDDLARVHPTFGLALAALPQPEWAALSPSAPLRRHRLIELSAGSGPCRGALRIDERVLHYLVGLSHLDERLHGLFTRVPAPHDLLPSHRVLANQISALWSGDSGDSGDAGGRAGPVIQLCGSDPLSGRALAAAACSANGLVLHAVRAADLPAAPAEREALLVLWEREARLEQSAALVQFDDGDDPEAMRAARAFIESVRAPLLVFSREPVRTTRPDIVRLFIERPTMSEQRALWMKALGPLADQVNGQIDRIVSHFNLARPVIDAAIARSLASGEEALGSALWDACRAEARPQLDQLAERIDARAGWDDLVLPALPKQTLHEIVAQQRQRARVYETWGFAERGSRGLGSTALFAGASGTGKTMAAEVLARELGLDVYRIDLSQVVSKYIGETEKNLRRVFDAAETGSAILLFDEADALFGKRSEVKDSRDRYANIEVSYLLQRMEAYRGLAILTTNMKRALDSAFLRRIRFVVEFPFPGEEQRAEIWRRAFPAATPTREVDACRLARLPIAGGNIRNIALNAAFLAADAGLPVGMKHLAAAARSEFAKLEKPLDEREVRAWA
jgi:hypothetical protein